MNITLEADPDDAVLKEITTGIRGFNLAQVPDVQFHKIVSVIRDDDGRIHGGVVGRLAGDSVYMEVVWNDDDVRGTGLGRAMMLTAEAEAKRLGAREAWLYTMSFQAKPFYEKLGYSQFAELDWQDGQYKRHFMRKPL
ncbi:MAG TPA: GNAT family N-acetyltransferase [Rhizomicrobium sp.]|jgi:GNAT superfamily N-acetyltransferase